VMEDGRLVEQGRHVELLAAGGLYDSLYQTQFSQNPEIDVDTMGNNSMDSQDSW